MLNGLAAAIILHALFDTIASVVPTTVAIIVLAGFAFILYYRVVRGEIKEAEEESLFRPRGGDESRYCVAIWLYFL